MKYLILADTVANQKRVNAGDVVELSNEEGNILVGYGKAEVFKGKEKPKKADRSVGLKTSDTPKPKARSKSK